MVTGFAKGLGLTDDPAHVFRVWLVGFRSSKPGGFQVLSARPGGFFRSCPSSGWKIEVWQETFVDPTWKVKRIPSAPVERPIKPSFTVEKA